jgi:hypothetical protein
MQEFIEEEKKFDIIVARNIFQFFSHHQIDEFVKKINKIANLQSLMNIVCQSTGAIQDLNLDREDKEKVDALLASNATFINIKTILIQGLTAGNHPLSLTCIADSVTAEPTQNSPLDVKSLSVETNFLQLPPEIIKFGLEEKKIEVSDTTIRKIQDLQRIKMPLSYANCTLRLLESHFLGCTPQYLSDLFKETFSIYMIGEKYYRKEQNSWVHFYPEDEKSSIMAQGDLLPFQAEVVLQKQADAAQ